MDQQIRGSGSALVAAVWLLASILVLSVFFRLLYSFRYRKSRLLPVCDDALVIFVGVLALASILSMSATMTDEAPQTAKTKDEQIVAYAFSILFVLVLNLSKLSTVIWLKRLTLSRFYKRCTNVAGCIIVACMLATATSIIFQCQLPSPWDIKSQQCLSSYLLWTAMIAIDIAIDILLIFLPTFAVMTLEKPQRSEGRASFMLSLRTLLIIPSLIRLVYLQQTNPNEYNILLSCQPYAIATICQTTLAAILCCSTALPYLTDLVDRPSISPFEQHEKHRSDSSFGSDLANEYFTSRSSPVIMEPLPSIQASMASSMHSRQGSAISVANSSANARKSLFHSRQGSAVSVSKTSLIHSRHGSTASIASSIGKGKAPLRPPPPPEDQRPDMETFTRRPKVLRPPPVTLLRGDPEERLNLRLPTGGLDWSDNGRVSKHVKFDV